MKLVLEDGSEFYGACHGLRKAVAAEIVFNTQMVDTQEAVCDEAYAGKIVVMTYPQQGQSGINSAAGKAQVAGLVVRDFCTEPSNFLCEGKLGDFLTHEGVPCLEGPDTRMLTRRIRMGGRP